MLTYPSDSLTQIVCPMDEDAIPPNPLCSAPPHSEPPPPFLSLSSITPSCAKDGISGHRRSGRIQGIRAQTPKKQSNTDGQAAQRPCRQNPSPTKRQRESGIMVQVAQCKLSRTEGADVHESPNKDGFDCDFAAEWQNRQKDQKAPQTRLNPSPGENAAELLDENTAQSLDAPKSDMDTCGDLAAEDTTENAYSPKGWVIGPLFQSLKSKMASFTEIVMSPVKLFRASSPPLPVDDPDGLVELKADGTTDDECSEPSNAFHPERQSENEDDKASQREFTDVGDAQNPKMVSPKYSKKLEFDGDSASSFKKADEFVEHQKDKNSPALVPLPHCPSPCTVSESVGSSIVLRSSANASASFEPRSKMSGALTDQKFKTSVRLKPLPRKRAGNGSDLKMSNFKEESDPEVNDKQLSYQSLVQATNSDSSDTDKMLSSSFSVCYTQPDVDCFHPDGGEKSCSLVRQSLQKSLTGGINKRTLRSTLDFQQQECLLNPVKCSVSGFVREKRGLKLNCHSQDSVKRKRLPADTHTDDTQKQELPNMASGSGIMRGMRLEEIELINEEAPKLARHRPVVFVSTRVTRKGKSGQEMLSTIKEAVLHSQAESSPDAMLVCSLDKSTGVSEDNHTGCSVKAKTAASCKRQKRTILSKSNVNIDSIMDLETTVAVTSTKQDQLSSETLVRPHIKPLQGTSKCGNINKKPQKRKSPIQTSSVTESGSSLVSTSSLLSVEPLELMPKDVNTTQHAGKGKDSMRGLSQLSKRPKKGLRGVPQSCRSSGTQETQQCVNNLNFITKESQSKEGKSKNTTDPVYFKMTPFESNFQPIPLPSQLHSDCPLKLNIVNKHVTHRKLKSSASVAEEIFHTDSEAGNDGSFNFSRLRSSTRRANSKSRQADNRRRKCRVLHSRTLKSEDVTNSVTMDDASLATSGALSSENGFSNRLLRSYSCPEILCLRPYDTTWTSPHPSKTHTSHQSTHSPPVSHAPKSVRRARRHTVCSVEVEREIAPLCLRKEVYPSRRSAPYDPVTHLPSSLALSPSTSISALASCFLSSPLAFLSKKFDSKGASGSPSTSSHVFSPSSSSSLTSPLSSSTWHHSRTDSCGAAMDSSSSGNPSECETERRQQSEEEDDGEDTSSSSQEFEDVGIREEKALSDSEIKVVQKNEEQRKVSSIRIRKTLPKPQNNLTPMGLPKPIRLKKKEFSLEEIYTNKNFSKPPESRLETIFEVPLNRRNGSESWFGQRRVKRFLEFLEVGEARKPKKPLVGVGKAGISTSRTRRGGFLKDEPSLSVQDVDSLLCAKLDQLNLWLIHDQKDN